MKYVDRKRRILVIQKDPLGKTYSVYLCYPDGRVKRTEMSKLCGFSKRPDCKRVLREFAAKTGCRLIER